MRKASLLSAVVALLVASAAYSSEGNIRRSERRIAGRYIAVLEPGTDVEALARQVHGSHGAKVRHKYQRGLKGLSLELSEADALVLARDPRVQFVEEDAVVSASSPWGLDRIDQRSLPLDGTFVSGGSGAGVTVYIVDTGIAAGHAEFDGRVGAGFSSVVGDPGTADCNGHGTHVAGVVGGSTYGVAKSATLVPVRVLDCGGAGTVSTVLAGLDWILDRQATSPGPAVANMSLGGTQSSAVDLEVERLVLAGVTTVVAAGNDNTDACNTSPARVPAALTVGASDETDARASFSNYGNCVDLFAPGSNILSAWYDSTDEAALASGTSSAAPFVAGVAALWLEAYPSASPAAVSQTILSQATSDALSDGGAGSPNRLLYSLVGLLDESTNALQLLGDPGFEYGSTFWTSEICTVIKPTGCIGRLYDEVGDLTGLSYSSRHGSGHVSIGGPARSFLTTSETIAVPSSISRAELSVYLWVVTKNKKKTAADVLTVEIRDSAGVLVETLGTFSNLDAGPTYAQRRFDISRYRGKTIRISFAGVQSQGPPTYFLLDDIALNAWR
jgi:hypothetical protein